MTSNELQNLFAKHNKSARDFIRWAATWGVKIHDTELSLHLSQDETGKPKRKISRFAELNYRIYFQTFANH